MKKTEYTKEQKQHYFENLRKQWHKSKELAMQDTDGKLQHEALMREAPDSKVSYFSFYFTLQSMKALELDGLPYIDCKTLPHWNRAGYAVIKGERALIDGIVWVKAKSKKQDTHTNAISTSTGDTDIGFLFPKKYKLFHRSQVKPITF